MRQICEQAAEALKALVYIYVSADHGLQVGTLAKGLLAHPAGISIARSGIAFLKGGAAQRMGASQCLDTGEGIDDADGLSPLFPRSGAKTFDQPLPFPPGEAWLGQPLGKQVQGPVQVAR